MYDRIMRYTRTILKKNLSWQVLAASSMLIAFNAEAQVECAAPNVLLVLDGSGSMQNCLPGGTPEAPP